MCQTLCADTAHCIGYTFVEVAFDVGGVGILVVVLVLGGALAVVVIVAVIQHPYMAFNQAERRCDLKDSDGASSLSEESGVISGQLEPLR